MIPDRDELLFSYALLKSVEAYFFTFAGFFAFYIVLCNAPAIEPTYLVVKHYLPNYQLPIEPA
jgi:hypothetical protein